MLPSLMISSQDKDSSIQSSNGFNPNQLSKLQQLTMLLHEQNLTEIHYKDADFEITLHRSALTNALLSSPQSIHMHNSHIQPNYHNHNYNPSSLNLSNTSSSDNQSNTSTYHPNDITITSSLIGTIYLSPSPDSPAFITVGSKVEQDDVLCIIECMKTMNRVKSPCSGTVKAILVNNEQAVDYSKPLIIITKL